jgi:hypothetical protein
MLYENSALYAHKIWTSYGGNVTVPEEFGFASKFEFEAGSALDDEVLICVW